MVRAYASFDIEDALRSVYIGRWPKMNVLLMLVDFGYGRSMANRLEADKIRCSRPPGWYSTRSGTQPNSRPPDGHPKQPG
jgi:hypothetical protein